MTSDHGNDGAHHTHLFLFPLQHLDFAAVVDGAHVGVRKLKQVSIRQMRVHDAKICGFPRSFGDRTDED